MLNPFALAGRFVQVVRGDLANGVASVHDAFEQAFVFRRGSMGWRQEATLWNNVDGLALAMSDGVVAVGSADSGPGVRVFESRCNDGENEDRDGLIDLDDPGCLSSEDFSENDPLAECDDDVSRDSDSLIDWPADPGCSDPADLSELDPTLPCDNGIDDDGDRATDLADGGCASCTDTSERGSLACDNGIDDDGDGLIDYPTDTGCSSALDGLETPPPLNPWACGLGPELALLIPALWCLRRRKHQA